MVIDGGGKTTIIEYEQRIVVLVEIMINYNRINHQLLISCCSIFFFFGIVMIYQWQKKKRENVVFSPLYSTVLCMYVCRATNVFHNKVVLKNVDLRHNILVIWR